MKRGTDPFLVTVLQTQDLALLAVAKSLLDSCAVPYVIQGEHCTALLPLSPATGLIRPAAVGATLRVRARDAPEVRRLLAGTTTTEQDAD